LRNEIFGFLTSEFSASLALVELHRSTRITKIGVSGGIEKFKQLLHL
jgi:hypothetical protein